MRRATMSVEAQLTSCVSHLMPPVHAIPWARERSRLDGDWLISRRDQQDQGHVAGTPAAWHVSGHVWRWRNERAGRAARFLHVPGRIRGTELVPRQERGETRDPNGAQELCARSLETGGTGRVATAAIAPCDATPGVPSDWDGAGPPSARRTALRMGQRRVHRGPRLSGGGRAPRGGDARAGARMRQRPDDPAARRTRRTSRRRGVVAGTRRGLASARLGGAARAYRRPGVPVAVPSDRLR